MSQSGQARTSTVRRVVTLATATMLVAAACGGNGETDSDRDSDALGAGRAPASSVPGVPPAIDALGHHAENAYDMAKASDWAKASASVDSLETAVAADTAARTATGAALQQLRGAVAARDRRAALVAANWLTELGARLSAPHAPTVPADVTLLDYYGRELEIWAAASDLPKLRATSDAIGRTWEGLRVRVEQRGGSAEAARFGALVQRLRQARTVPEFAALATPILDDVDVLEAVFKR